MQHRVKAFTPEGNVYIDPTHTGASVPAYDAAGRFLRNMHRVELHRTKADARLAAPRCPFLERIQANNLEAERILTRHAENDKHVWPNALPDVDTRRPAKAPRWREDVPPTAGEYPWRLTDQWEVISRSVDDDGKTYSHRFRQHVDARRVGGEWFY